MKSENRERITRKFVKCFIQTDFHQYEEWCIGEIAGWEKKHFTICTKE
jgi:hypothetical protein